MARQSRNIREYPDLDPIVTNYALADHRYTVTAPFIVATGPKEARESAPYRVGDVVLTVYGEGYRKALILSIHAEPRDLGEWHHLYRISRETASGRWSRLWFTAHPGQIQRAYWRAGYEPERLTARQESS